MRTSSFRPSCAREGELLLTTMARGENSARKASSQSGGERVHAGGARLRDQHIVEAIDDEARAAIGFGVDQAIERRADQLCRAGRAARSKRSRKELRVDLRAGLRRQDARGDQAVRIEIGGAELPLRLSSTTSTSVPGVSAFDALIHHDFVRIDPRRAALDAGAVLGLEAKFRRVPSQHRRENAVGRFVAVGKGLDVDDDLLAHVDAAFERGRAHVRQAARRS